MGEKGVTTKRKPIAHFGPANVWFCDECGSYGDAKIDPDETVKGAVQRIRKAHARKSPNCSGGTRYIRLMDLETIQAKGLIA